MGWFLGALGIGGLGAAALFFIPGLLPRAIEAAGALLGVVRRNPWQCAVMALLLACGLLWRSGESARDERDGARALAKEERANHVQTIANYREAQKRARAFAVAQKNAEEARHKANAERIDREHETHVASAGNDIDRHLARVRGQASAGTVEGGIGSTPAAADNRDPGVLAGLPANYVPVAESDLRACAAATAYALSAREWALGLAK